MKKLLRKTVIWFIPCVMLELLTQSSFAITDSTLCCTGLPLEIATPGPTPFTGVSFEVIGDYGINIIKHSVYKPFMSYRNDTCIVFPGKTAETHSETIGWTISSTVSSEVSALFEGIGAKIGSSITTTVSHSDTTTRTGELGPNIPPCTLLSTFWKFDLYQIDITDRRDGSITEIIDTVANSNLEAREVHGNCVPCPEGGPGLSLLSITIASIGVFSRAFSNAKA